MPTVTPAAVCERDRVWVRLILLEHPAHGTHLFHQMPLLVVCVSFTLLPVTYSKQGLLFHGPALSSHICIISHISLHPTHCATPFVHSSLSLLFCLFLVSQSKPTPICLLRASDSRSSEKQSLSALSVQVWVVKLYGRALILLHLACHHLGLNVDVST